MRTRLLAVLLSAVVALAGAGVAIHRAGQSGAEVVAACAADPRMIEQCLPQALDALSSLQDVSVLLAAIDRRARTDVEFTVNRCHTAVHTTAERAIDVLGVTAFEYPEITCQGGYLHGLFLSVHGSSSEELEQMLRTCLAAEGGEASERRRVNCFHGYGHGLTLTLPDGPLDSVFARCKTHEPGMDRQQCTDGAMMSFYDAVRAVLMAQGTSREPQGELTNMPTVVSSMQDDDYLWHACDTVVDRDIATQCASYVSRMLAMVGADEEQHLQWCAAAATYACANGLGMERYGNYPDKYSDGLQRALAACSRLGELAAGYGNDADQYRRACQFGAVYPLNEPTRVAGTGDFAGCAVLPTVDQSYCREGVERLFVTA